MSVCLNRACSKMGPDKQKFIKLAYKTLYPDFLFVDLQTNVYSYVIDSNPKLFNIRCESSNIKGMCFAVCTSRHNSNSVEGNA